MTKEERVAEVRRQLALLDGQIAAGAWGVLMAIAHRTAVRAELQVLLGSGDEKPEGLLLSPNYATPVTGP